MNKVCTKCGEDKKEEGFSPGSSWCKGCRNTWMAFRKDYLREKGEMYMHPEDARPDEEDKYLSPEEWVQLVPWIRDKKFLLYLDITQSLGLRANETFGLRDSDFDWDRGVVKVRSLKRKDRAQLTLYVRPDLLAQIRKEGFEWGFKYASALARFKRALKWAGLNPRLGIHSLRHLCATRCAMIGASQIEIARVLRHTISSGSVGKYIHVIPQRLKEICTKMWEEQPWLWKGED